MADDLMQYAFRALAGRALTERELRERLGRRGAGEAEQARVVGRLRELGYLDDAEVARMVSERRGVGRLRVKSDLARRGVERETAEEVLSARGDEQERENLMALVERYREKWLRAPDPKAKAFGFLARRGFAPGMIFEALRELDTPPSDR